MSKADDSDSIFGYDRKTVNPGTLEGGGTMNKENEDRCAIVGGSINQVVLVGNVRKINKLRRTVNGLAMLQIHVETSESYLDKDRVRRDRFDVHRITVWGKAAEALETILRRGHVVTVVASLRVSKRESGGKRYRKTEVVAQNLSLVRPENQSGPNP